MECSQEYFIHNFKFYNASDFNETILNTGTCIYEVIRIENGVALFLESHLNRLFYSADISGLNINEGYCDFESLIDQLIAKNQFKHGKIKIVVKFDSESNNPESDLLIYFTPHYFPSNDEISNGVSVGVCSAIRTNPNAKILHTEARKKANHTIAENKLFEVLLKDNQDNISEGSRSNVFFIKANTIYTPPVSDVLNGITRSNIINICKKNKIAFIEKKINLTELNEMESAFLSGTSLKVLPIRRIDSKDFNVKNTLLLKIIEMYNRLVEDYLSEKLS